MGKCRIDGAEPASASSPGQPIRLGQRGAERVSIAAATRGGEYAGKA
jgi:hypothetical protein